MKTVQVPVSIFFQLYSHFQFDDHTFDDGIKEWLQLKHELIYRHLLFSKSKTAETEEEREQARQEYLDEIGVPDSFRY